MQNVIVSQNVVTLDAKCNNFVNAKSNNFFYVKSCLINQSCTLHLVQSKGSDFEAEI